MKVENTKIYGFEPAIRGMRNPLNSWNKSDSLFVDNLNQIGEQDMKLAQNLILSGNEHGKFLRMIQVWVDLTLPRYIWSEFDTYHYNTKNSCSTMHKLFDKKHIITTDLIEYDKQDEQAIAYLVNKLNLLRESYFQTKDQQEKDKILTRAKSLLPEGFLQKRTINTNYAELRNMYFQRQYHRLRIWHNICDWIKTLPYAEELITIKNN